MKFLIILGFAFIVLSIYLSVRSDNAKKYSDDSEFKKFKLLSGVAMGVAVALIAGCGIAFLANNSSTGSTGGTSVQVSKKDDFGHDETDAWVVAQTIVEGKLKVPSSADFCRKSQATISRSGNTWTVSGFVDAKNSFGVSIRSNFTVRFTFTSGSKYKIDKCVID